MLSSRKRMDRFSRTDTQSWCFFECLQLRKTDEMVRWKTKQWKVVVLFMDAAKRKVQHQAKCALPLWHVGKTNCAKVCNCTEAAKMKLSDFRLERKTTLWVKIRAPWVSDTKTKISEWKRYKTKSHARNN